MMHWLQGRFQKASHAMIQWFIENISCKANGDVLRRLHAAEEKKKAIVAVVALDLIRWTKKVCLWFWSGPRKQWPKMILKVPFKSAVRSRLDACGWWRLCTCCPSQVLRIWSCLINSLRQILHARGDKQLVGVGRGSRGAGLQDQCVIWVTYWQGFCCVCIYSTLSA